MTDRRRWLVSTLNECWVMGEELVHEAVHFRSQMQGISEVYTRGEFCLTGVLCAIVLAARARNTLMNMERVFPIPIILQNRLLALSGYRHDQQESPQETGFSDNGVKF